VGGDHGCHLHAVPPGMVVVGGMRLDCEAFSKL
jgi:hypothetical protein